MIPPPLLLSLLSPGWERAREGFLPEKKFRAIPGNLGYQMMREDTGAEAHFMVVSYWSSRDAIHAYAGADISRTRHLPRDADFQKIPEKT